jgi:hypothetical protein
MAQEIQEIKEYRLVKVNIEKLRISQKKYYEKNKEKIQQWQRENKRQKYNDDPEFREKEKLRTLEHHRKKKEKKILENIEKLKVLEKI